MCLPPSSCSMSISVLDFSSSIFIPSVTPSNFPNISGYLLDTGKFTNSNRKNIVKIVTQNEAIKYSLGHNPAMSRVDNVSFEKVICEERESLEWYERIVCYIPRYTL
ncbi:hypothetical protein GLOIN_2v1714499 [Rhizophagus irregularis DAOM 181602=DAOM 197198]|uniref:Uncharacterized protein n=1 Tax=Rhizophagus irregularis (strain DAOM 181602 / DAOM 197198 / MUCL 43194) TaxID=747089 RepID=A0A2P4P4L0_RHIID|nr:hypothetical protein GLOIN_2v1714499 [Rhizophagus irregularis DAOM 181602=DAOM 197198]POG60322.1 hypothetical protein GLOIN_2v1714499 [Rhizophagus irregularis DAOM 181602=DAOM 197198]|eukprot:XP_025167188.1 hypothetical protein GLOIN_2v1714499 [Rhizophagus irregularis DAOM 181602=DAOM 197198]